MSEEKCSEGLIQSYIKDRYFVSTIHRRSSAMELRGSWYYETIVWEWDVKTRERGKMLDQHDSGVGESFAIGNHCGICKEYALLAQSAPLTSTAPTKPTRAESIIKERANHPLGESVSNLSHEERE